MHGDCSTDKITVEGPWSLDVISAKSATVTVDESGIHNTVSINRVTLGPKSAKSNDGTDKDSNLWDENHLRDEDGTDENDARIVGEFQVQGTN